MRSFFPVVFFYSALWCAPNGFHLVDGDASMKIYPNSSVTEIISNQRAIIEWDQFSIDSNEIVRFTQNNLNSAVLNRVVGPSISEIYGQIESNGKIFLINQNGVLFGPNAKIITSEFIASTLDVLNKEFLQGDDLTFKGLSEGSIVNLGTIQSTHGDVILISRFLKNEGKIEAPKGAVALASNIEVLVSHSLPERVFIRSDPKNELESSIENSGAIEAMTVEIKEGYSLYSKGINQSGVIDAKGIKKVGGKVFLTSETSQIKVDGTISAQKGDSGGEIHVLGKDVHFTDCALLDASAMKGDGGDILIGGSFQGKDPSILHATTSQIEPGAQILANGKIDGHGGSVVVWSDDYTAFYGTIETKGGGQSGNGGDVEVSGGQLDFHGLVDRTAPNGAFGHLLLDPINVTISGGADSANVTNPGGPGTYAYTGCAPSPANIDAASLVANLNMGSVTINTDDGGLACGNPGNISVTTGFTWTAASLLSLVADGGISFTSGITISNSTSSNVNVMDFQALGGEIDLPNITLTTDAGNISMTANGTATDVNGIDLTMGTSITSNSGSIMLNGTGNSTVAAATYGISMNPATIQTTSGQISLTGTNTSVSATQRQVGIRVNVGSTIQSATGDIIFNGTGSGPSGIGVGLDVINSSISVTSTSGSISITGVSNGTGGVQNTGVRIETTPVTAALSTGTITIDGTSGDGTLDCYGVVLDNSGVSIPNGSVDITGEATNTLGGFAGGMILQGGVGSPIEATNISMTGIASPGGIMNQNQGIFILGAGSSITSNGGNFSMNGTGGGVAASTNGVGINITDASITSNSIGAATPPLMFTGVSGIGETATGFLFNSSGVMSTADRDIVILGTSNGTALGGQGVSIQNTGTLETTGTGNIQITGFGGPGTAAAVASDGVFIIDHTIRAATGTITIEGTANATSQANFSPGVRIARNTAGANVLATGSNPINITGTVLSSTGQNDNQGIIVSGLDTLVEVNNGDLTMTGTGNGDGTGGNNTGIEIITDSVVRSTGTGRVLIDGTGGPGVGPGANTAAGVLVAFDSIVEASTTASEIRINGQGGAGTYQYGVHIATGSIVRSNAPGAAPITITGTGGTGATDNSGVVFSVGTVSSVDGDISIIGSGVGDQNGFGVDINPATITSTGAGNINIMGTGGSGTGNSNRGISFLGASTVTATNGAMTITGNGGMGMASNHGVFMNGGTITQAGPNDLTITGTGGIGASGDNRGVSISGGTVQSSSNSAPIRITGTPGLATDTAVLIGSATVVSNLNSPITVTTTAGDCLLNSSTALISSQGSGLITMGIVRDLTLNPGTIRNVTGNISATVGRDVNVLGGPLLSFEDSQIGNSLAPATGSILFPSIGRDLNVIAVDTTAFAIIGHGSSSAPITPISGDITFSFIGGNVTVTGANGGFLDTSGYAQIGHVDSVAGPSDMTGDINFLEVGGSVNVNGGTVEFGFVPLNYALIGHGGQTNTSTASGNIFFGSASSFNVTSDELYAKVGHHVPTATGNIDIQNVATSLNLTANSLRQWAQIGHGIPDNGAAVDLSGNINISFVGSGGINLEGAGAGAGTIGLAQIGHIDANAGANTIQGNINLNTTGSLNLIAGNLAGSRARAMVGHGGEQSTLTVNSSNITSGFILGNVNVTGGSQSTQNFAQIGHNGFDLTGDITFLSVGNNVNINQGSQESFSLIGHGDPSLAITSAFGNITFGSADHLQNVFGIGSELNITGANAGAGAFGMAHMGHIAQAGAGATLSGNITARTFNSIFLTGGNVATAFARVGHNGLGGSTVGASNILLIADHNITLTTPGLGIAQIINESQFPNQSNLTLVTDNDFPASPGIGPFGFFKDEESLVEAQTPNTGFTAELRIYTARVSQNGIDPPLNGFTLLASLGFPFPSEGNDDDFNQYCFYYPDGIYIGPEFIIYYKTPCPDSDEPFVTGASIFQDALVANDQLRRYLPMFEVGNEQYFICHSDEPYKNIQKLLQSYTSLIPEKLKRLCRLNEGDPFKRACVDCSPEFYLFNSFIFENDVK